MRKENNAKKDPCWDNYEMVGMKTKNGKQVPNCVPKAALEALVERSNVSAPESSTVCLDVPFLTRLFEQCREDIKSDVSLHFLLQAVLEQQASTDKALTMADYWVVQRRYEELCNGL